ncbi:MAG: S4 domain-containing protein, partial [Oscillospiraceae bacterium]
MMKQRLQKIIAGSGVCSRRAAEALISEGKVRVNGVVAIVGETADDETDEITIDNSPIPRAGGRTYIMLNKPRGYVTSMSDEHGRKTVADLVADVGVRVYPVGRLDMNSEGL